MTTIKRIALAVVASAAIAVPAMAQQAYFSFTTRGCFYSNGGSCTANGSSTNPAVLTSGTAQVSFLGVTNLEVGPTNSNGYVALSNLGTFTFLNTAGSNFVTLPNTTNFKLWIDFVSPANAGANDPLTLTTEFDGKVNWDETGKVSWNFPGSSDGYGFTYAGGGSFRVWVDDQDAPSNWQASDPITGKIDCSPHHDDGDYSPTSTSGASCVALGSTAGAQVNSTVPEPSTYALLAAGLAGLGAVARRRRRNV